MLTCSVRKCGEYGTATVTATATAVTTSKTTKQTQFKRNREKEQRKAGKKRCVLGCMFCMLRHVAVDLLLFDVIVLCIFPPVVIHRLCVFLQRVFFFISIRTSRMWLKILSSMHVCVLVRNSLQYIVFSHYGNRCCNDLTIILLAVVLFSVPFYVRLWFVVRALHATT